MKPFMIASCLLFVIIIFAAGSHTHVVTHERFRACSNEQHAYNTLLAIHDVATSPLVNKSDVNMVYSMWSSQMIKRGVPEEYITPQFFNKLYELQRSGAISDESVVSLLREI